MRKRSHAAVASIFLAISAAYPARAAVTVEQLEGFEDPAAANPKTHYAPVDFAGSTIVAPVSGIYSGITFHVALPAVDAITSTYSDHANAVGSLSFGSGSNGFPYVTNVYNSAADNWIPLKVNPQNTTSATGPVPGHFDGGAQVINNSYVDVENSNVDALRRFDFMIHRDDVTFVAGAVLDPATPGLDNAYLDWSAYNSLAVTGSIDPFVPTGSPGKTHADVFGLAHASFAAAMVTGAAAGLYGHAQGAAQTNAQHDVVMRSLIMTGADKVNYFRQTTNNLSLTVGAGLIDYSNSLGVLTAGEQPLKSVIAGLITGPATTNLKGWSYGPTVAGGQTAVIFHSDAAINGLTATLNWDVDHAQPTPTTIDTTTSIFADLGLELRPLTSVGGAAYLLGSSFSDVTLQSDATNDNVEHLYFTGTLPAGDYAFLIRDDATLSPNIGFSYTVSAVPEPSSLALLALIGTLTFRRRRD